MPPTASPPSNTTVLLSYAHEDRESVRAIAQGLQNAGYTVWWDEDIQAGTRFRPEIEQQLQTADVVLVVWSAHAKESHWVPDEAQRGMDRGVLLPVTLDGSPLLLGFGGVQTLDFSGWNNDYQAAVWAKLLKAVAALSGAPPQVAPRANGRRALGHVVGVTVSWTVLFSGAFWIIYGRTEPARWVIDTAMLFGLVTPSVAWAALETHRAGARTWQYLVRRSARAFAQGAALAAPLLILAAVAGITAPKTPRGALVELLGVFVIATVFAAAVLALTRLAYFAVRRAMGSR